MSNNPRSHIEATCVGYPSPRATSKHPAKKFELRCVPGKTPTLLVVFDLEHGACERLDIFLFRKLNTLRQVGIVRLQTGIEASRDGGKEILICRFEYQSELPLQDQQALLSVVTRTAQVLECSITRSEFRYPGARSSLSSSARPMQVFA